MTSFNQIATQIVKESIKSVVYIDEQIRTPFDKNWNIATRERSLYNSFYNNDVVLLDLVKFDKRRKADYYIKYFEKRDLVLLDWNLNPTDTTNKASYDILSKIIETPNIHFCCIYTSEDQNRKGKILSQIYAYYSGLKIEDKFQNLGKTELEELDSLFNGWDEKKEKISGFCHSYFLYQNDESKTKANKEDIIKYLEDTDYEKIIDFLNSGEGHFKTREHDALIKLCFITNHWQVLNTDINHKVKLSDDGDHLFIDNLVVVVLPKETTPSEEINFYDRISKTLTSCSNIFLTLFGLEMRAKFLRMPSFISDEIEDIEQASFFHHRKNHADSFNSFMRDNWSNYAIGFWYNQKLETLDNIELFLNENQKLTDKIGKISGGNKNRVKEFGLLNYVYNRLKIKKKQYDKISFGDIFEVNYNNEKKHLLCITPLCDCLNPHKIDNNYFFIQGHEIDLSKCIQDDPETKYVSFIKDKEEIVSIKWTKKIDKDEAKPFTLFIKDYKLSKRGTVKSRIGDTKIELRYIMTLKQNYTQRLANYAFGYPIRVGIDFASIK